jgi:CelD/BcsL family acetyltransferase involved in cellulose biosynthesis
VRIEALPLEWPAIDAFIAGIGEAGLLVRRFAMFGNWHEAVAGRSWPEYLADRAGSLRELIRRKSRRAARTGQIEFETVRDPGELFRAIAAYETVYSRSWKPPEPCPRFNPGLMREAAAIGALRVGIGWLRGTPVAVQLWIVANRYATVMKLAHDEAHRAHSPGTLLTARMVEELIGEGVETIDFGRGDDPYKRLWARERRQRIGLLLLNPRRVRGLVALARHDAGRAFRPLRSRAPQESAPA